MMSASLKLPLWQCNSPSSVPDCSEELDIIIQRLAAGDTELDGDSQTPVDSRVATTDFNKKAAICDSESGATLQFQPVYRLNNNVSEPDEFKCIEKGGKCGGRYVCQETSGRSHSDSERESWEHDAQVGEEEDRCLRPQDRQTKCQNGRVNVGNVCGSRSTGDGGGKGAGERSERQQHELRPAPSEINTRDVTESRDSDVAPSSADKSNSEDVKCGPHRRGRGSKSAERKLNRPRTSSCSTTSSTCSAGSYSRRKHHKHHKHKQRARSPPEEPAVSPRVNPIFLWVRQEDTRIVEVMCEDYDHRNRIRLAKTPLGWRSIPKTEHFAAAVIPKAPAEPLKQEVKHRKRKKSGKKKKCKSDVSKIKTETEEKPVLDNCNIIRECSVSLSRDDLELYENRALSRCDSQESLKAAPSRDTSVESRRSRSPSGSRLDVPDLAFLISDTPKIPKSSSCEFSQPNPFHKLARSASLEFTPSSEEHLTVQNEQIPTAAPDSPETESTVQKIKDEPESTVDITKEEAKIDLSEIQIDQIEELEHPSIEDNDLDSFEHQRNNSESIVMDMTKHDADFNDADCDELGQLLKDIPDLEFVEEEELEEVDEDEFEDMSIPTDLTLPKINQEETKPLRMKLPVLPPNISSLVTVTSSTRPPEPLTAPLPEVTITPIPNPNPKPAHQQKPQNKFLESLLSSPHIKPERDEITITRTFAEKRPAESLGAVERRKHSDMEPKNKRLKVEDITLKSLLSKQSDKTIKTMDIESCVKKMKNKQESDSTDCSKSRLQELLTDGITANAVDPIAQLKQVLSNPDLAVPDPLLVPRARLPALVASPASEIPRLLTMHLDKKVEERPPPITDPDMLVVSLSHLRSLLSYNPDRKKSADSEDLAAYQKSLEAFLEWQRYQTELMEAQMKNSAPLTPGLSPGDIDVATATALNQMLWLPYLNQLESAAISCNNNRDFMSFWSSMFSPSYPPNANNISAPPHISTNHFPQSSPFLTPTSPMDIESQMKTLAMWQEAIMSQQNSHPAHPRSKPPPSPQQEPRIKIPSVPPPSSLKKQSPRLSPLNSRSRGPYTSPYGNHQKNFNYDYHVQMQQQALLRQQQAQQYEFQKKQQKHQAELQLQHQRQLLDMQQQRQLEMHHRQRQEQQMLQFQQMQQTYSNFQEKQIKAEVERMEKKSRDHKSSISVKPLSNLIEKKINSNNKSSSWQQFEEDLKKSAELTKQMALRWQQFEEEMRKSQIQITKNQKNKMKMENLEGWQTTDETRPQEGGKERETPKLKVKNLVDPSMSPPKLLKQVAPEHLPAVEEEPGPVQEDPQSQLWHPLFGSNQIRGQSYNSPWRWTTVTVNGE